MKRVTRILCLALCLTLALTCLCAQAWADESAYGDHLDIRWYSESRDLDLENDRILNYIQDKFNITFEFIEPPADGSSDRLNLLTATGEPLDLVTAFDIDAVAKQWAQDDFIYSYDELLEGKEELYPLLTKYVAAEVYSSLKVNGKSYFKPLALWPGNRGYVINKDWLDKLGLDIPTTLDEYYEVIRAFAQDDPDGNGKDDTYGFFVAEPYGSNSFGYICRAFVNCGGWGGDWCELEDGTISQFGVTEYAREAFRFITKCYDENLFNRGFVNEVDASGKVEDLLVQGRIGLTDASQPQTILNKMQEAGVSMNIVYLPPLVPEGKEQGYLPHSGGYWAFHIMPRTCQDTGRVLDLLEWALTEEGRVITDVGLEGVHGTSYTETETDRTWTLNYDEMTADWNTSDYGYNWPLSWGGLNYNCGSYIPLDEYETFDEAYAHTQSWGDSDPTGTLLEGWYTLNATYAKLMPLAGVVTDEFTVSQNLIDIEISGRTKAITGGLENFDANWDEWVALWYSQGGQELQDAANAYYAAHK